MTKRYGIGICICALVMCSVYWGGYKFMEQPSTRIEEDTEDVPAKTVTSNGDEKVYSYYLIEEDGYVSVYLDDRITLYETTSIAIKYLPEILQEELKNGKALEDEHDLYNFLENYSS